jgi:hypothetical protein
MATADKTEKTEPAPALASAAASGDPAVHQLIAEADIARQNGDEDGVQAALVELKALGYQ